MEKYLANQKRQLQRNYEELKKLTNDVSTLSIYGYEHIGYLNGMIRIREELLDEFDMLEE